MSSGLKLNPENSDEILLRCKGDKRTLKASKSLLAKHSKYFEGITGFGDKEAVFDPEIISFDILKRIIGYIEMGVVKHAVLDEVEELLAAADYLQADFVFGSMICFMHLEAEKWMQDMDRGAEMRKQDLLVLLRVYRLIYSYEKRITFPHKTMAMEHRTRSSREKASCICNLCPKFLLVANFKRLINELAVLQMEEHILHDLLSDDHLRLTEEEVLRVVKMWCYFNLAERREAFERLVKCVRINNNTITTKFVMDELTCNCRIACDCLTSKDLVISMLSHRLNAASAQSTTTGGGNQPKMKRRASNVHLKVHH